jgi:hypothetical protein
MRIPSGNTFNAIALTLRPFTLEFHLLENFHLDQRISTYFETLGGALSDIVSFLVVLRPI